MEWYAARKRSDAMRLVSSAPGLGLIALLVAGCGVGTISGRLPGEDPDDPGPDGDDPDVPAEPTFSIQATPAIQELTLGTTAEIAIEVTADGEFSGAVTLAASGLPASW